MYLTYLWSAAPNEKIKRFNDKIHKHLEITLSGVFYDKKQSTINIKLCLLFVYGITFSTENSLNADSIKRTNKNMIMFCNKAAFLMSRAKLYSCEVLCLWYGWELILKVNKDHNSTKKKLILQVPCLNYPVIKIIIKYNEKKWIH